jgi:hypothetical protein
MFRRYKILGNIACMHGNNYYTVICSVLKIYQNASRYRVASGGPRGRLYEATDFLRKSANIFF